MFKNFIFVIALAASPLAFANNPVTVDDGGFANQRAQIEKELADGKTYAEISRADRTKVVEALDRMSGTLATVDSVDALSDNRKIALYNDQQTVNTILTQAAEDSRQVCTREQVTGSHRKTTVCASVAERRRRREQDQETMSKSQRSTLPKVE